MTLWNVELRAQAYLDATVQVEADTYEEAHALAFAWAVSEDDFEGEKFYLTGDAEVLGIELDEDGEVL